MVTSWKTTIAGIISIGIAIWHCVTGHTIDLNCIGQILVGAGLISAKDFNVTGGTTPNSLK